MNRVMMVQIGIQHHYWTFMIFRIKILFNTRCVNKNKKCWKNHEIKPVEMNIWKKNSAWTFRLSTLASHSTLDPWIASQTTVCSGTGIVVLAQDSWLVFRKLHLLILQNACLIFPTMHCGSFKKSTERNRSKVRSLKLLCPDPTSYS